MLAKARKRVAQQLKGIATKDQVYIVGSHTQRLVVRAGHYKYKALSRVGIVCTNICVDANAIRLCSFITRSRKLLNRI